MTFDPNIHARRSLRLQGYDYAQAGAYFVTICAQDRACLFGAIVDGVMQPNDIGAMIVGWWAAVPDKFPSIETDVSVLMPNHWHGILVLGILETPSRPTLARIVGWFKTMSTNAYFRGVQEQGWPPVRGRLWQRNYYEHIIRDDSSLTRIREYIASNPMRWAEDQENPLRGANP